MKLFLSSHNFGNFAQTLRDMVGTNRKTLVITNARDYKTVDERREVVKEKMNLFHQNGFDAKELDLRKYFSLPPESLEKYILQYDPGLIFCIGGDIFLLATALNISSMDDIIRSRVETGKSVYGGNSAGAIIAAEDIEIYERDELQIETMPEYYGVEAVTSGLGLIDEYIIPHVDVKKFAERTKFYQAQLANIHAERIQLNDSDVYVVNGNRKEVKRG